MSLLRSRWLSRLRSRFASAKRRGRAVARKFIIESLESRKVMTASLDHFITTEHTDLRAGFTAGGGWTLGINEDVQGALTTDEALIYVGNNAAVGRPSDPAFDFTGAAAGEDLYFGSQTQEDGLLYLGANTSGVNPSAVTATNPNVESKGRFSGSFKWVKYSLVDMTHTNPDGTPGDGEFSAWSSGSFGTPTVLMASYNDGVSNPNGNGLDVTDGISADDAWWIPASGHAHYNFGFSKPGRYEVQLQVSANFTGAGVIASDPITVYFSVGSVGQVEFDADSYTISEDGGSATVNVHRVGGNDGQFEVDYEATDGSATGGEDFELTSGTLIFADGETQKQIVIPLLDDNDPEEAETILVSLLSPQPDTIEDFLNVWEDGRSLIGANSDTQVSILDDDTVPEPIAGLTRGHADIGIAFEEGEFDLHVHVHGQGAAEEDGGFEYSPDEILIEIGPSSAATVPTDPSFGFIGEPTGAPIFVLPATEQPDLPFLGHATEEIGDGIFLNDSLILKLKAVSGPGHFSLWSTDSFGAPTAHMASSDGVTNADQVELGAGLHLHFDTAFTEAGNYALTFEAIATLADGTTEVSSGNVTYYFSVNQGLAPAITLAETELTYTEQAAAKIVDSTASLSDADSIDFDGGQLRVDVAAGAQPDDVLSILHQGNGVNQIGVSGNTVTIGVSGGGTIALGTFSGGTEGEPLVVDLTAEATASHITRLMRRIAFQNSSNDPTGEERVVRFVVSDGDGEISDAAVRGIVVTPVNDKPVVTASGSVVGYTENGTPVVIDPSILVTDADSADFDLGKLTVKSAVGSQSTDRFGIEASGLIGVAGNTVSYNGTPIGTFGGTTTLTVTFNSAATPVNVQELARHIVFSSLSDAPSTTPRQISFSVSDGDGGTSPAALGDIVNLTLVNDAPALTLSNATAASYLENAAPVLISSGATVVDVDLLNFDTGVLTVALTANGEGTDMLAVKHTAPTSGKVSVVGNTISYTNTSLVTYVVGTFTGGDGVNPLVITFNANALKTEVQAVMKAITFASSSDNPSTAQRTVSFTLTDGDGGTSNTVIRSVNVTAKNDAPGIASFGPAVNYSLAGSPVIITNSATISDIDSADFNTGKLIVALTTNKQTLDRVEIQDGNGITASAGTVSYNGDVIGTYAGTTTLTITFNSAFATPGAVEALLRQLTFRTTSTVTLTRTVTATLYDGDAGISPMVSKSINVA